MSSTKIVGGKAKKSMQAMKSMSSTKIDGGKAKNAMQAMKAMSSTKIDGGKAKQAMKTMKAMKKAMRSTKIDGGSLPRLQLYGCIMEAMSLLEFLVTRGHISCGAAEPLLLEIENVASMAARREWSMSANASNWARSRRAWARREWARECD